MLYGHLDKQPPLLPWAEGLGPYKPVIKDGKVGSTPPATWHFKLVSLTLGVFMQLYGRGGADGTLLLCLDLPTVRRLIVLSLRWLRSFLLRNGNQGFAGAGYRGHWSHCSHESS